MGQLLVPLAIAGAIGGTALAYQGNKTAGASAMNSAQFTASQLAVKAGQDKAASQRLANEDRTNANLAESTVINNASAAGGGADVSTVRTVGRIAERGEYNALTDLYNGNEAARGANAQSVATIYEGQQTKRGYDAAAKSSVFSGITSSASLFSKYGAGGPSGSESSDSSYATGTTPYYRPAPNGKMAWNGGTGL